MIAWSLCQPKATIPTGSSLASPEALALVSQAVEDSLLVVAFCGGTRVLAAAQAIGGVRVTGHPDFLQEYLDAGAIWAGDTVPPVLDGNILTSRRGQYYSQQICEVMRTAVDSLRVLRGRHSGDVSDDHCGGSTMKRMLLGACILVLAAGAARAQLDTLWTRTFGGAYNDGFQSVIETTDGGFIAVGYTHSFGEAGNNVYAVKIDGDGNTEWSRAYGGSGRDYGFSVCEIGGGYAIAGYTTSFGAGREDVYLVRITSAGDTLWTRTWGGPARDEARSIWATTDGGLLVGGATESFGSGESDMCVLKVRGRRRHSLDPGIRRGPVGRQSVCETADGCYGIGGTSGSNTGNRDLYLVKTDAGGNLVWQNYYGSAGNIDPDWGTSICATDYTAGSRSPATRLSKARTRVMPSSWAPTRTARRPIRAGTSQTTTSTGAASAPLTMGALSSAARPRTPLPRRTICWSPSGFREVAGSRPRPWAAPAPTGGVRWCSRGRAAS